MKTTTEHHSFSMLESISRADAARLRALAAQLSPDARFDARALARSVEAGTTLVFVIRRRSRIVASATAVRFSTPTGEHCRIEDVVVDGALRGGGLGRVLMTATLDTLHAMKIQHVELTSRPSRVAATSLYRSLGFTLRETCVYELRLPRPCRGSVCSSGQTRP
jgi:phosphinothricin acetyltransferase